MTWVGAFDAQAGMSLCGLHVHNLPYLFKLQKSALCALQRKITEFLFASLDDESLKKKYLILEEMFCSPTKYFFKQCPDWKESRYGKGSIAFLESVIIHLEGNNFDQFLLILVIILIWTLITGQKHNQKNKINIQIFMEERIFARLISRLDKNYFPLIRKNTQETVFRQKIQAKQCRQISDCFIKSQSVHDLY